MGIAWALVVTIIRAKIGEAGCPQGGAQSEEACQENSVAAARLLQDGMQRQLHNVHTQAAGFFDRVAQFRSFLDGLQDFHDEFQCHAALAKCLAFDSSMCLEIQECFEAYEGCKNLEVTPWNDYAVRPSVSHALAAPADTAASVCDLAALAADNVYPGGSTIENTPLQLLQKEETPGVLSTDTVALYQSTSPKGVCFLAFSGSDDIADWFTDANSAPDGSFCGHNGYHLGFSREAGRIMNNEPMFEKMRQHWTKCDTLYVVGNSLGGALASMVAECINCKEDGCNKTQQILDYPRAARLITFGAPAYSTHNHPSTIKGVRFWNKEDPIPTMAWWSDRTVTLSSLLGSEGLPSQIADMIPNMDLPAFNREYQHPAVLSVGMKVWRRHLKVASDAILNYVDPTLKQIAPIMVRLMLIALKTHTEDRWDDYPHKMKAYRDRVQMAVMDRPHFPFQFRSKNDANKCLDVNFNNDDVYVHQCHGGKNQVWRFADNALIKSEEDMTKCLFWNRERNTVQVRHCDLGSNEMKWMVDTESLDLKPTTDDCLDWHLVSNDAYVHRCHGGDNQKWYEAWTAKY